MDEFNYRKYFFVDYKRAFNEVRMCLFRLIDHSGLPLVALLVFLIAPFISTAQSCRMGIGQNSDEVGCLWLQEDVAWYEINNSSENNGTLTKIGGGTSWNGGAFAFNALRGNGSIETVAQETNRERAFGLSQSFQGYGMGGMQYAMRLRNNGTIEIRESNSNRGNMGSYQSGDTLRIVIEENQVQYYRNQDLLYVSNQDPIFPLFGQGSLRHVGATLAHTRLSSYGNGNFSVYADGSIDLNNATIDWQVNGSSTGVSSISYSNPTLEPEDVLTCQIQAPGDCSGSSILSNEIQVGASGDMPPLRFFITSNEGEGGCQSAIESIQWDVESLQNVEASPSGLKKIQGGTSWNAFASSLNKVMDFGSFHFQAATTNRHMFIGLNADPDQSGTAALDFAFELRNNGSIRIRENGSTTFTAGNYAIGDEFELRLEGDQVHFIHNGDVLAVSLQAPNPPLYVDAVMRHVDSEIINCFVRNVSDGSFTAIAENAGPSPIYQWFVNGVEQAETGALFSSAELEAGDEVHCMLSPDFSSCTTDSYESNVITKEAEEELPHVPFFISGEAVESACFTISEEPQWDTQTAQHVELLADGLQKIQGGNNWNGGASSLNPIRNFGKLRFSTNETNRAKVVGLSPEHTGHAQNSVSYGFYLRDNGQLRIYESGVNRGTFGNYQVGDTFEISLEDGEIKYYHQGELLWVSNQTASAPLFADLAMRHQGGSISNLEIINLSNGHFQANLENAGDNPHFQWLLNGNPVGDNSPSFIHENMLDGDEITCLLTPDFNNCDESQFASNTIRKAFVPEPAAIDFYISSVSSESSCHQAIEEVSWNQESLTNLINEGSALSKIQGGNNWNAHAYSNTTLGDHSSVSIRLQANNSRMAIGLSNSTEDFEVDDLDYCFRTESNGTLRIYESGTFHGNHGTYSISDSLSISIEAGLVSYYKNGELLRVSTNSPQFPLRVVAAVRDMGGGVAEAFHSTPSGGVFEAFAENAGTNPQFQWMLNGASVGDASATYVNEEIQNGDVLSCELLPDLQGCEEVSYHSNSIRIREIESASGINFSIGGVPAQAACFLDVEEVQWDLQSIQHLEVDGNNLNKIQGGNSWNGAAASLNRVHEGGSLSFSTQETNQAKAFGLSHAITGADRNSIEFCFSLESNGSIRIYESGSNRGTFGNYQVGDSLSIGVENNTVRYYHNGELLRISPVSPTMPLLADASIHGQNGSITDVYIRNQSSGTFTASTNLPAGSSSYQWFLNGIPVGDDDSLYVNNDLSNGDILTCELSPLIAGCQEVTYISNSIRLEEIENSSSINFYIQVDHNPQACFIGIEPVVWDPNAFNNVNQTQNGIEKIQGSNTWDGNAASVNRVYEGGNLSFRVGETNRAKAIGLSQEDVNNNFTSIEFCFRIENNGSLRIYESGLYRGQFGNVQLEDSLSISVDNFQVKYFRNNELLYISNLTPSLPLQVDVSLHTQESSLRDLFISNTSGGLFTANAEDAGAEPSFQWLLNGNPVGNNEATYLSDNLSDGDVLSCILTPDLSGCGQITYTSQSIVIRAIDNNSSLVFFAEANVGGQAYAYAIEDLAWDPQSFQFVDLVDGMLTKIQGGSTWNGGAASQNTVKEGGYFEFSPQHHNRRMMVGLSQSHPTAHFNTIQFAFSLESNGNIRIFESGVNRGTYGTYSPGDQLRIGIEGGTLRYYRNGELLYTSLQSPSLPLLVSVSILTVDGAVHSPRVANLSEGHFSLQSDQNLGNVSYQWLLNGQAVGTDSPNYFNPDLVDGDHIVCALSPGWDACGSVEFLSNAIRIQGPGAESNWLGVISENWHHDSNWSHRVPNQFQDAIISASAPNMPVTANLAMAKDVEIAQGASLTIPTGSTMRLYGNILNEGDLIGENGTLVFQGSGARILSGEEIRMSRVLVNLESIADSVVLNTNLQITDELLFFNGIIYSQSSEVVFLAGSMPRFSSANSYVDGACRKIGNEAFTFPVGNEGVYAPVRISAPASPTSSYSAQYFHSDPEELGVDMGTMSSTLNRVSRCEYWNIEREDGSSPVHVSLSYENVRSCGVEDPLELRVVRWNGSTWQDHGYLMHEGSNEEGFVMSGAEIPEFSPFTLGSSTPINPLPIQLLDFSAQAEGQSVLVNWRTASEINNDFFTIERSADGIHFERIATVAGAGNSNTALSYSYRDEKALKGTSYYRLRQTDFDGTSESFAPKAVYIEGQMVDMRLYPNPTSGLVQVYVNTPEEEQCQYRIFALSGALVKESMLKGKQQRFDLSDLTPGIYLLNVQNKHINQSRKLIIQR